VNEQSKQIRQLQNHASSTVTRTDLTTIVTQLQTHLTALEKRISKVEKDTSLTGSDSTTIGSLVSSNRRSIARSLDVISNKVSQHTLTEVESSIRSDMAATTKKVLEQCVTVGNQELMRELLESLGKKVSSVESTLLLKVDSSTIEGIKLDAETVREKAKELTFNVGVIRSLESDVQNLGTRVQGVEEVAVANANRVILMNERLNSTATNHAVQEINARLQQAEHNISNDLAKKKDFDKVSKIVENHGRSLATLNGSFDTLRNLLETSKSSMLDVQRSKVDKKVFETVMGTVQRRDDFEAHMKRLMIEVDAKAWGKDVGKLGRDLEALKGEHATTKVKASLATKFVEWYGKKGEVYEANLGAMDEHMKNLAVSSYATGQKREPYGTEHEY
jgi:hypothetical protein